MVKVTRKINLKCYGDLNSMNNEKKTKQVYEDLPAGERRERSSKEWKKCIGELARDIRIEFKTLKKMA